MYLRHSRIHKDGKTHTYWRLVGSVWPNSRVVQETVASSVMAAVLVIARLCEPSSELHTAEGWYRRTPLEDLLGLPAESVNEQ